MFHIRGDTEWDTITTRHAAPLTSPPRPSQHDVWRGKGCRGHNKSGRTTISVSLLHSLTHFWKGKTLANIVTACLCWTVPLLMPYIKHGQFSMRQYFSATSNKFTFILSFEFFIVLYVTMKFSMQLFISRGDAKGFCGEWSCVVNIFWSPRDAITFMTEWLRGKMCKYLSRFIIFIALCSDPAMSLGCELYSSGEGGRGGGG